MFSDSASLTCEARFRGPSNFCAESLGLYGATEKFRTNLKTSLDIEQSGIQEVLGTLVISRVKSNPKNVSKTA